MTRGLLLLFFAFLAYPAFLHLLPRSYLFLVSMAAGYVFILHGLFQLRQRTKISPQVLLLMSLVPLIAVGVAINRSSVYDNVILATTILVASTLSWSNPRWIKMAAAAGVSYCLIHSAATLLFFVRPEMYGPVRAATGLNPYPGAWDYRSALTGHYSYNAMYCAIGLILTSALALSASTARNRMLALAGLFTTLLALILTTKRAHLVLAFIALIAMLAVVRGSIHRLNQSIQGPRGWSIAAVVGLGTVGFMWASPSAREVLGRLTSNSGDFSQYSSGRTQLWSHAVDQWHSSPVFGVGWSGYQYAWVDDGLYVVSVGAHNVLLQLLAETGVVGVAIFLMAYSVALFSTITRMTGVRDLAGDGFVGALAGSFGIQVFFGLYALVGNPLYDPPTFAAYLLAVSASVCAVGNSEQSRVVFARPAKVKG
jgi:O-antigen ligase